MDNCTVTELIESLTSAAAYTIFNSNASDKEKQILTSFVDTVAPGFLDAIAKSINVEEAQ